MKAPTVDLIQYFYYYCWRLWWEKVKIFLSQTNILSLISSYFFIRFQRPISTPPPPLYPLLGSNLIMKFPGRPQTACLFLMDEGPLKTPIPLRRLYWSFLFGVVKQFCRFWIWSEKNSCKIWSTIQFNTPPPHPSHTTVWIYYTFSFRRGGGGRRSERRYCRGATVHKYISFVHGDNSSSSQTGLKISTTEGMYLQSIKSV